MALGPHNRTLKFLETPIWNIGCLRTVDEDMRDAVRSRSRLGKLRKAGHEVALGLADHESTILREAGELVCSSCIDVDVGIEI